jgi:hypothetical protein
MTFKTQNDQVRNQSELMCNSLISFKKTTHDLFI